VVSNSATDRVTFEGQSVAVNASDADLVGETRLELEAELAEGRDH
jgi:hypothetical protein